MLIRTALSERYARGSFLTGKLTREFLDILKSSSLLHNPVLKYSLVKYLYYIILIDYKNPEDHLLEVLDEVANVLLKDLSDFIGFIRFHSSVIDTVSILNYNFIIDFKTFSNDIFELLSRSIIAILNVYKYKSSHFYEHDTRSIKLLFKNLLETLLEVCRELDFKIPFFDQIYKKVSNYVNLQNPKPFAKNNTLAVRNSFSRNSTKINFFQKTSTFRVVGNNKLESYMLMDEIINAYLCSEEFEKIRKEEYMGLIHLVTCNFESVRKGKSDLRFELFVKNMMNFFMGTFKSNYELSAKVNRVLILSFEPLSQGSQPNSSNRISTEAVSILMDRINRCVPLNLPWYICNMLKDKMMPLAARRDLIKLGKNILYDGCALMQKNFYDYFEADSQTNCVEFLAEFAVMLEESFKVVKKHMKTKNKFSSKRMYGDEAKCDDNEVEMQNIKMEIESYADHLEICEESYKFLQLLCEGHNSTLQNYLRTQRSSPGFRNINLVEMATQHWGNFIKFINSDCYGMGFKILEFLIEAIQGPCTENQREIYKNKIIEHSKEFLLLDNDELETEIRGFAKTSPNSQVLKDMITANIKLLNSLVEANDEMEIFNKIAGNIDFNFMVDKLETYYNIFKQEFAKYKTQDTFDFLPRDAFKGSISEAFNIIIFIQMINHKTGKYTSLKKNLTPSSQIAYNFFQNHTQHIEIVLDGKLYVHYFILHPCYSLLPCVRDSFEASIDRSTPIEKITGMINQVSLKGTYRVRTSGSPDEPPHAKPLVDPKYPQVNK